MTHEYLLAYAHYDETTGVFYKKSNGQKLGYKHKVTKGDHYAYYIRIAHKGKYYYAHRLAMFYISGSCPPQVDHINGDTLDNSKSNLRPTTAFGNMKNMKRTRANTSGFTGVHFYKRDKKWEAKIHVNGRSIILGRFLELEDAIKARKKANIEYGFHENHGRS